MSPRHPGKPATLDATAWYGLRFDLALDRDDAPFAAEITLARPPVTGRQDMIDSTQTTLRLQGKGWHAVTLPFSSFDYPRGQSLVIKGLNQIVFAGRYEGSTAASRVLLRNIRLVRGDVVHLSSDIRSRPADADGTVTYTANVTNCDESPRLFNLALERSGW